MMMRLVAFFAAALCLGCSNNAQSQRSHTEIPAPADSSIIPVTHSLTAGRQNAITRAVQTAAPAIVSINVIELQRVLIRDPMAAFFNDPFFRPFFADQERIREVQNLGSGFIISPDGYIVTNDHVAGSASRISVSLHDGRTLDARLVGTDPISDLALLKVEPIEPLPYLPFPEQHAPIVGEWAIALGNPFGLFEATEPSVTVGVVSAVKRDLGRQGEHYFFDMIQTDASINPGNSGGPLVNALGEVIGVNTAIFSEAGGSVGLGFAVPASKASRIVTRLQENGEVNRSYYSGLAFLTLTKELADQKRLQHTRGVLVARIDPNSPASQAGFLLDDVVVAVENESVSDFDDYRARMYDFLPGDVLHFDVYRNGEPLELSMRIGTTEDNTL